MLICVCARVVSCSHLSMATTDEATNAVMDAIVNALAEAPHVETLELHLTRCVDGTGEFTVF